MITAGRQIQAALTTRADLQWRATGMKVIETGTSNMKQKAGNQNETSTETARGSID